MTLHVIQRWNNDCGRWEDEGDSFAQQEAARILREARSEFGFGNVRRITRRI